MVSTSAGSRDGVMTTLRYGGGAGDGHYRVFAKYHDRRSSPADGLPVGPNDAWDSMRGGFRYDTALSERDELEIQGQLFRMDGGQRTLAPTLAPPYSRLRGTGLDASSGFVLSRWKHSYSDDSELSVQAYYDGLERQEAGIYALKSQTVDVELQHRLRHSDRAELTWGLGARSAWVDLFGGDQLRPVDPEQRVSYFNAFAQEEFQVSPDKLFLTLGAKLEDNSLGGLTLQPTARVSWTPGANTAVWAAVSRAARAPSLGEQDVEFDIRATQGAFGLPALVTLVPNQALGNEFLTAYEAGFRMRPRSWWSLDIVTFYNRYSDRVTLLPGEPRPGLRGATPFISIPILFLSSQARSAYGGEITSRWRPTKRWSLTTSYSYLHVDQDQVGMELSRSGQSPMHQASATSSWSLPANLELDVSAAYVDHVRAPPFNSVGSLLGDFVRADFGIGWRASQATRFSFGVHNLFDGKRIEFQPEAMTIGAPVGRNVYGNLQWTF